MIRDNTLIKKRFLCIIIVRYLLAEKYPLAVTLSKNVS